MSEYKSVEVEKLKKFVEEVFKKLGVKEDKAWIIADVLVLADQRGIESHGVARLKRYVDGIKKGIMLPSAEPTIEKETPVSLLVNGNGGMGQIIAYETTKMCIEKAKKNYICLASIRNSNHYGIAGYYSLMALKEGMIGISLTNAAPLVVPTFGKNAILGTNPISVGFPSKDETDYLLDMATSTVPRGKLEVYARKGKKIPLMWATDENGSPTDSPERVLDNLLNRRGGGLLPLGGGDELTGGHKGYGLAMLVELFTGVLSGGAYGTDVYGKKGEPADVAHFIGVINPEAFIGEEKLRERVSGLSNMLRNSEKADGRDRIYIHGEKEFELFKKYEKTVPIQDKVYNTMKDIADDLGVEFSL